MSKKQMKNLWSYSTELSGVAGVQKKNLPTNVNYGFVGMKLPSSPNRTVRNTKKFF